MEPSGTTHTLSLTLSPILTRRKVVPPPVVGLHGRVENLTGVGGAQRFGRGGLGVHDLDDGAVRGAGRVLKRPPSFGGVLRKNEDGVGGVKVWCLGPRKPSPLSCNPYPPPLHTPD